MISSFRAILIAISLMVGATLAGRAELVLRVDTMAKEFSFGGNDSGTTVDQSLGGFGEAFWDTPEGISGGRFTADVTGAFESNRSVFSARFELHETGNVELLDQLESGGTGVPKWCGFGGLFL